MYACIPPVSFVPLELKECFRSPETRVTGGCMVVSRYQEPWSLGSVANDPNSSQLYSLGQLDFIWGTLFQI